MCLPLLAIGAIATAAGTAAKFFGEKQAERARDKTFNAERARQEALSQQQQARFQDSVDRTGAMTDPAAHAQATAAREGVLADVITRSGAPGGYLPGSSSAPALVATATDKAGAKSEANSMSLAHALAALGATGDQMQGLNIGIGRNSQQIGQLGGFKAGSMGVLDSEMKAAAAKGGFLRGIGGLAQQLGMAAMSGGMGGGGSAAGAAKSTSRSLARSFAGAI